MLLDKKNLFLKPEIIISKDGHFNRRLLKNAETNVENIKFDYLLSLIGVDSCAFAPSEGPLYLGIGDFVYSGETTKTGYLIDITENGIFISGQNWKNVSDGLKMVINLLTFNDELPCAKIYDTPKISFRGIHMCVFKHDDGTVKEKTEPEDIKKMLKLAALCGYNYAFIEFWGMFPYKSRPYAVWEDAYSPATVKELIDFAIDDLHITPVPVQNLTSHAAWSRISSRKHVVLDRHPEFEDMYIPGGWCFATRNEKTKLFLKDVISELTEAFRNPPMFHCSCDKCFGFGSAEDERIYPADRLFEDHIKFLHDELAKKNIRMVMWADMIYSEKDSLYWKASPEIADRLPKDILMNIWTHRDIGDGNWNDTEFFKKRGFETVCSPFLDREGAKNMINLCEANKSLGLIQTTWHKPQTASETVAYSGAKLWNTEEPDMDVVEKALLKWYSL